MSKSRKDYVYVAHRIDPNHPQNLGDFGISRRIPVAWQLSDGEEYFHHRHYHFNSKTGRLINRGDWAMPVIQSGSQIYQECWKAINRLLDEEHAGTHCKHCGQTIRKALSAIGTQWLHVFIGASGHPAAKCPWPHTTYATPREAA